MLVEDLVAYVISNHSDLLSERVVAGRVDPKGMTTPFMIVSVVTDDPRYSHDGDSGISETIIQMDVYDEDLLTASTVANTVKEGLSGFKGTMGDSTIGAIFLQNWRTGFYPEGRLHRAMCQLDVKYS